MLMTTFAVVTSPAMARPVTGCQRKGAGAPALEDHRILGFWSSLYPRSLIETIGTEERKLKLLFHLKFLI